MHNRMCCGVYASSGFNFFFAAAWQNCDLRSSKEGPRQTLFKHFLSYFQNISLVELGFEASKFLHKCEPPLWSHTMSSLLVGFSI